MPSFEQVVTVIALATGPLGIWFGWWLGDHSRVRQAAAAAAEADRAAELERAIDTGKLARALANEGRSLAHGIYLEKTRGRMPQQMLENMESYNVVRSEYRTALLRLRVLGPTWAVAPAERIEVMGQQMTQLMGDMQQGLKAEHMTTVNAAIPAMETAVDEFIDDLSKHYNPAAGELPDRPDLEVEGRY